MTVDAGGRVALSVASNVSSQPAVRDVVRLTPAGAPDTGFGGDGSVRVDLSGEASARQTTFQNVPAGAVTYVLAQKANGYGAHSLGFG